MYIIAEVSVVTVILFLIFVLEDIVSVLVGKQLIGDLVRPQAAYSHSNVREIIEDITQSSVMRLDPVSMNKLWDLITMVFKWQMSVSDDVIGITLRHLYEIETFIVNQETHQQLQKVQSLVENFGKILDGKERKTLHQDVLLWTKDYNVKVSLLLRMGLQNMDGHFVINNLDPIAEQMLRNLGENIYQVTQNGRILENNEVKTDTRQQDEEPSINELQLFADELLGERKLSSEIGELNTNHLKLAIQDINANKDDAKTPESSRLNFDSIDVSIGNSQLEELMADISLKTVEEKDDFKDDLLSLIGGQAE